MVVLLVEDEQRIASFLSEGLQAEGYATALARDGVEGLSRALAPDVGLVVLDVMLPRLDGRAVLAALRQQRPDLPVLVLTARDDLASKVQGLDAGADDYLTKPFAFEELLARIRALLRRRAQPPVLTAGGLTLDLHGRCVRAAGRTVELTSREFALLEYLMRHPSEVLSRAQILRVVWQLEIDPHTTVLETTLNRLRRKLQRAGAGLPVEAVRGAGYRYAA